MMTLGVYTFTQPPLTCTIPQAARRCKNIDTLGGTAFFSWGPFLPGQKIEIKWRWMSTTMFDAIYALLIADAQVVWDPENSHTYNVEITGFTGDYHLSAYAAAANKKNVKLKLTIMSQAS
ncbi:MAG: hypothetical protein JRE58_02360 [Deltaproteobacteria bacterium]|nr:hypothetical protein [Deltaproteobacteria bacterium]